jgi:Cu/Ag efflux protein CusF
MTVIAAISLTACGGSSDMDHSKIDDSKMDHSTIDETKTMGDTGHTTGVIFSISPDGTEATIDHQEIEGVGMGAMTMGFGITSTVDLSGFAKDDNVSFMVKKGRDGSYRITAICNTDIDGKDCLDAKMDHSGH